MCSNPSVNSPFSRILQLDLDFCEATSRVAIDTRQRVSPSPARKRRFFEPAELEALEREYLAGATLKELAVRFGVHKHTVSAILKRRGVQVRYRSLEPEQIDQAKDLYASGLSTAQVGSQLSCSGSTIWLALKRSEVEFRDCHGRAR